MINPWVYLNHSSIYTNCSPLQPSYRTNGIGQTGVHAVILNSSNISSGPGSGSTLVSAWLAAQDHTDTNLHNHESWLPFSHAQHCFYYGEVGYRQRGQTQARILNIIPASSAGGVGLILVRRLRSHILHRVAKKKKNHSFLCSQFIDTSVNPLESIEVVYSKYRLKC